MATARVSSNRVWSGAAFATALALAAGCSDQGNERRGGGDVPDLNSGGGGAAGNSGAGTVPWCDAYKIINCSCQQCHRNPPVQGAPIPLLTYEDTQAPFPYATSSGRVWQTMQTVVASGAMPFRGDPTVMPPVKELTAAQLATLATWFKEGAQPLGGRDCPQTCNWSSPPP